MEDARTGAALRPSGPSPEGSVRDERKRQTRRALVDAALDLFASQGYDATGTEQIAQAAGVSPRTFFRYFPTKESVILSGAYDFVHSLAGVLLAQPSSHREIDALRDAFVELAPAVSRLRRRIKLYKRAIASSVALRGRERDGHVDTVATVACAIAARRGLGAPDDSCEMAADIALLVVARSLDRWLAGPARTDLGEVLASEFDMLSDVVTPAPPPRQRAAKRASRGRPTPVTS